MTGKRPAGQNDTGEQIFLPFGVFITAAMKLPIFCAASFCISLVTFV